MKDNLFRQLVVVAIPVLAAFAVRFLFGVSDWSTLYTVMSLTYFILTPYLIGIITIYFSIGEHHKRRWYSATFPWVPIIIFFLLSIFLKIEGLACWIMIFPVFLLFASLGGLTARYFRLRKSRRANNL